MSLKKHRKEIAVEGEEKDERTFFMPKVWAAELVEFQRAHESMLTLSSTILEAEGFAFFSLFFGGILE